MISVSATATATNHSSATANSVFGCCPCPCPPCPPTPPYPRTPVILFSDANCFDDFISIILLAKDPKIEIKLIVIEAGFTEVNPAIDILGNLLDWLYSKNYKIVRGYYLSEKEVEMGFNPNFEQSNPERANTVGLPFCKQIVPGPWRGFSCNLYGNQKRIPVFTSKNSYNAPVEPNKFIPAEDHVKIALDEVKNDNKAIIFANGSLTTFSKFIKKYIYNTSEDLNNTQYMLDKVDSIRIMGGNFNNKSVTEKYLGIPPVGTVLPDETIENGLNGNVFTLASFGPESNYRTQTECNVSLDPEGAKVVYDYLGLENVDGKNIVPTSYIVTTNATDNMDIPYSIVDELLVDKTYESELVSDIFKNISTFEGGPELFNIIIKLWDIASTLLYLNPSFVENVVDPFSGSSDKLSAIKGNIEVHLPVTYDPAFLIKPLNEPVDGTHYYGELTFTENQNSNLHVVYDKYVRNDGPGDGQNPVIPLVIKNMIERLKSKIGTANIPLLNLEP